jgi:uncharacterized cupredoxin-like copper-binding protein
MQPFATFLSLLCAAALLAGPASVLAAGDLTQQTPIELKVKLGDETGALRFAPAEIVFETGKLYRLVLANPSPAKHYFSSDGFSQAVFTRKVQVNGPDGKAVAEIKGLIREIEVYPNGSAEWWLIPLKAGTFIDLKCTIPGHTEAGMVGRIVVK